MFSLTGRRLALVASLGIAEVARPEPGRVILTLATHYTNEQRRPLTRCFERYEQLHPGIKIAHRQLSYRDFVQTLFMARMGGTAPDISSVQAGWAGQLVRSGSLAPPPLEVAEFVRGAYLPETVAAITLDERLWGIPSEVNLYMLVYNKLLLAKAGYARPPGTWDELVDAAKKVRKLNRQGHLTTAGFAFGPSPAQAVNPFLTSLFSKGVTLFAADRRSTRLTGPEALEALEGQVALFRERVTEYGSHPNQFPSGSVGMMIVPNWYRAQLQHSLGARFHEVVGVAPIPGGERWRTLQYAFFWAVDGGSRHAAESWALLRWLNSAQAGSDLSCTGEMVLALGALTANRADLAASRDEVASDSFMQPFVDALAQGRALPEVAVPHASEIESVLRSYIERAWLGRLSAAQALSEADRAIRMILAESD